MSHRIMYLRDRKGQPVGCIAIKVHRDAGTDRGTLLTYQYSVLNPQDRFNRALARQLALGRLVESPFTARTLLNPSMYEINLAVMKDIARDSDAPTRARNAAKLWIRNNEYEPTPFGLFG